MKILYRHSNGGMQMRLFEMLQIIANMILIIIISKKINPLAQFSLVGLNIIFFILHTSFEGIRYQMSFSYIILIAFIVLSALKIYKKEDIKGLPKFRMFIIKGITMILLIVTGLLAYILPVFKLPRPTGDFPVGTITMHFIDNNRLDPFSDNKTEKRELMVKVFYPGEKDDTKKYEKYMNDIDILGPEMVKQVGLPSFSFNHLSLVKSHSKEGIAVSMRQEKYPLVIFSHGFSASKEIYYSLLENLASQGYIVAAVDHTYLTLATVFPNRATFLKVGYGYKNTSTMIDYCDMLSDDLRFVIGQFEDTGLGKANSIFKDKIYTNKIGVFGHSFGGSVAYNLCFTDKRVKAGIDIDGTTAFLQGSSKINAPFLMIATSDHTDTIKDNSKLTLYKDLDLSYRKYIDKEKVSEEVFNKDTMLKRKLYADLRNTITENGILITIKGTEHMNFSDTGLYFPFVAKTLGLTGNIEPERAIEITNSCVTDFFDKHLKNKPDAALDNSIKKYKEIVLETNLVVQT